MSWGKTKELLSIADTGTFKTTGRVDWKSNRKHGIASIRVVDNFMLGCYQWSCFVFFFLYFLSVVITCIATLAEGIWLSKVLGKFFTFFFTFFFFFFGAVGVWGKE